MDNEKFNLLRDFANWVRVNVGKSANIDVSIWCHTSSGDESTEYRVWVEGLIHKSSKNIDELVGMIPKFKQYCELSMEVSA
jgi:hypothetical protein